MNITEKYCSYAGNYLMPLDYADENGNCRLCNQPAITARHNCTPLRDIATEIMLIKRGRAEKLQQNCPDCKLRSALADREDILLETDENCDEDPIFLDLERRVAELSPLILWSHEEFKCPTCKKFIFIPDLS